MRKRKDIDALRALAIIGVVLHHVGLPGFRNGYIGVDIFFVVSGYLVLGSVVNSVKQDEFSLLIYLERRSRRIFPAVYLVLAVNLMFVFVIFSPSDIEEVLRSYLSILLFTPNVFFWRQSGYFDPIAKLQPFLHTWSLGLELQFYFAVGITALLVIKYSKKSVIESWLVKICVISFILCVFLAYWKPGANFYLLPSRLWEFALGGLTAIYTNRRTGKTPTLIRSGLLRDIGFLILICAICLPFSYSSWPGFYTSIPALGTVLVLLAKKTSRITSILFENPLFTLIGKVSFGWFLWHWPLIVYANYFSDGQISIELLLSVAIFSLVLAVLQWHVFERRFTENSRVTTKRFKRSVLISSLSLMLVTSTGIYTNGFKQPWSEIRKSLFEESTIDVFLANRVEEDISVRDSGCLITYSTFSDYDEEVVEFCKKLFGPAIFIIGDSHGLVFYDIIQKLNPPKFIINWSRPTSRPSSGIEGQYEDVLSYLEMYPSTVSKILFVQSGSYLLEDELGHVDSYEIFRSGAHAQFAVEEIESTLTYLQRLAKITKVVWIGPYIQSRININNPSNWYQSNSISKVVVNSFRELDSYLKKSMEESTVSYVSSLEILRFPSDRIVVGNCIAWRDEDHFSKCGRRFLASSKRLTLSRVLE